MIDDPAALSGALGFPVRRVRRAEVANGGLTARVIRLLLDGDGPPSVIAKIPGDEPRRWAELCAREVRSYRELGAWLPAPRCLHAAHEPGSDRFVLILEDLTGDGPGLPLQGLDGSGALLLDAHLRTLRRHDRPAGWPDKRLPEPATHRARVASGLEQLDRSRFAVSGALEAVLGEVIERMPALLAVLGGSQVP